MSLSLFPILLAALALPTAPTLGVQEPGHDHDHPGHTHDQPAEPAATTPSGPVRLQPVTALNVRLSAGLVGSKFELDRAATLPALLAHAESNGFLANFAIAGGGASGEHRGPVDADAIVYAWIEGASNTLLQKPDPELVTRLEAIVDAIAKAQREDGYLNTSHQIGGQHAPWADLAHGRELYTGGRLIEAALAHRRATNQTKLFDVARKFADLVDRTFGPGKKSDPGADPGLESALCDLFTQTGEARYLALAKFFVEARGNTTDRTGHGAFAQDAKPVRGESAFLGDPLRGTRLYAGASQVARLLDDAALQQSLATIFADLVGTKMNIVGGIGSTSASAGVTAPFVLDSKTSAWDVRSAIGLAEWAHAMMIATGDAAYGDVVERTLFNAILGSVGASGTTFAPVHRLTGDPGPDRAGWPECGEAGAEVARFLAQTPELVFATAGNTIYISQFVPCEADFQVGGANVHLTMQTNWPLSGLVDIAVQCDKQATFAIKFRRPAWCKQVYYQHDLKEQEHFTDYPGGVAGWEVYERRYNPMDGCKINLIGPIRREAPLAGVTADQGRVAVCRGPLVYAVESLDNRGQAAALVLPTTAALSAVDRPDKTFTTIRAFRSRDAKLAERGADGKSGFRPAEMILIPFFQLGNRGKSSYVVWVAETPDIALR